MTNNVLPLAVPVAFTVVMALILGARLRPENRLKFALRVLGGVLLGIAGCLALFVSPFYWGKGSDILARLGQETGVTLGAQKIIYLAFGAVWIVVSIVSAKLLRSSVKRGVFDAGRGGFSIPIFRAQNPKAFRSRVVKQAFVTCICALLGVGQLLAGVFFH